MAKHVAVNKYYVVLGLVLAPILPTLGATADSNGPRITAIVKEARLSVNGAKPRPASVGDRINQEDEITTGPGSRLELVFDPQDVIRLGANTALKLKSENVLELTRGTLLIDFPGGAKSRVDAGAVSTLVGHATAVLGYHPTVFKFLALEGTARLYRPGKLGDSVLVHPGEMIFGTTTAPLTDPVNFDIGRFVNTCPLIQGFSPLPSERLITAASERQEQAKSNKNLIETNLVIFRGSSQVSIVNPRGADATPTAQPTPTNVSSHIPPLPQEVRP